MTKKIRIAIFASGGGSNAESIMRHFEKSELAEVCLVCSNRREAGVLTRAKKYEVSTTILAPAQYRDGDYLIGLMEKNEIDLIVLAGYLKLVPAELTRKFARRILNIHPALLPDFGGKGMYGMNVHKAVISSGQTESGLTIHYVDEVYDQGAPLFQHRLKVKKNWSPEQLQKVVLEQEHIHYPRVIEAVCEGLQGEF